MCSSVGNGSAVAEDVPEEEREVLWQEVRELNRHQGKYLASTERDIPLAWLRRLPA